MHRKDTLSAALWDLRAQYEEGLRALTGAQRAIQEWHPGASEADDRKALARVRACFQRLSNDNDVISAILRSVNTDLENWS